MSKTTKEVLVAARALIANEKAWTTGVDARDSHGDEVCATGSRAVCWCIEGAVARTLGGYGHQYALALDVLVSVIGASAHSANDRGSHADALALLDRAIEAAS